MVLLVKPKYWSTLAVCMLVLGQYCAETAEVVYAVNCGGNEHIDMHGVRYQQDPLTLGIPSDYGRNLNIQRVPQADAILYQTERYHTQSFAYEVPLKDDGQYVLVLKFSEVWFTAPNQKVFSVMLNDEHTVVDNLDIYYRVGLGVAHDEIVPFTVKNGRLCVAPNDCSDVDDNKINVKFVKGERDNPKVNALVLYKGVVDEVPKLAPHPAADRLRQDFEKQQRETSQEPEEYTTDEESAEQDDPSKWDGDGDGERTDDQSQANKNKKRPVSGPVVADPYGVADPGSLLIPIVVAIGAFVPIVFCLCKV